MNLDNMETPNICTVIQHIIYLNGNRILRHVVYRRLYISITLNSTMIKKITSADKSTSVSVYKRMLSLEH